jgi:hemerythrin-like domain-containing protein
MDAAMGIARCEHEAFGEMLDLTDDVTDSIRRGENVQAEVLGRHVEFFRVFM